jgi:hypothetical protein
MPPNHRCYTTAELANDRYAFGPHLYDGNFCLESGCLLLRCALFRAGCHQKAELEHVFRRCGNFRSHFPRFKAFLMTLGKKCLAV